MRALNVYTHYSLKTPKHLESFGTARLGKTTQETNQEPNQEKLTGKQSKKWTEKRFDHVARSETPADCATCGEFAAAAQLHRQPRQRTRHDARAMDRGVSAQAAGGAVAGRSCRRARTATDLAGAAARPPGRTWIARAPARSQGPPRQP